MATILSFMSGRQLTDADGEPLDGAKVYHYQAGTLTDLTVYTHQDGNPLTHAHEQPVETITGGFVPIIYVDDASDWKVIVTDAADVVQSQYAADNLSAAPADEASVGFAPPLLQWTPLTANATLTAADAGKAYECNSTAGNITVTLPSAASVGNGKGFCFKKIVGANSVFLAANGSEEIEGSSSDYTLSLFQQSIYIISDGANWLAFAIVGDLIPSVRMQYTSDVTSGAVELAVQSEMEAATDVIRAVVPGRQHFHPGHPKFWAYVTVPGGVPSLTASYNVTSVTDVAGGTLGVTIATDFSTANWCCVATCDNTSSAEQYVVVLSRAAGSLELNAITDAGGDGNDPEAYNVMGLGDQ